MADADVIASDAGLSSAPPPALPVDVSNVPAFAPTRAAYDGPVDRTSTLQTIGNSPAFADAKFAANPAAAIGSAIGSGIKTLATEDVPALINDPSSLNVWTNFQNSLRTAGDRAGAAGRDNALADSIQQHVDDIKQVSGAAIPNPMNGGFAEEADAEMRAKGGPMPGSMEFNPYTYAQQKRDIQMRLYQSALDTLASKHQSGSPEDAPVLRALQAGQSMDDYMHAFVQTSEAKAAADYAKSKGSLIPWLAQQAGSMVGSFRDPARVMGLAVGGVLPELQGASSEGRVLWAGLDQAIVNMGLTAAEEPQVQGFHKELGEDNGLTPALKDIWMSGLYGFVPGAAIRGIGEIFSRWGEAAPGMAEEFLNQAHGGVGPDGAPRAPVDPATREAQMAAVRKANADMAEYIRSKEAKGSPPAVPPDIDNLPRTTSVTGAAIQAAEDDHLTSPPAIDGIAPEDHLAAYRGMVAHGEDPDTFAPPIVPTAAAEAPREGIPPDHVASPNAPGPAQTGSIDGKPVTYTQFDPRQLGTDAQAFQYKGNSDQAGVTDRLKGVQEWNPLASGNVVVFERADGKQFIVDGHQRHGLAMRLLSEGHPPIQFNGALLKESDGWTTADARAIAAKKNIQEGSGEPLDTARVLRDRPDMWDKSLPTTSPKLKQAKGLAELSDQAWGMMLNGVVPQNYAALVGSGVADKANQAAVMADMAKIKPANENQARMIIADANAAGFRMEVQDDIFGPTQAARSLMGERAKVYDSVISLLKDDKKVFGILDREAEKIEAAGNTLVETNADQATRAAQLAQILEKLATRTGPVSAALNRAAQSVADGEKPQAAGRAFLGDVDRLIKEEGLRLEIPPALKPAPVAAHDTDTPGGRAAQTKELEQAALDRPANDVGVPWGRFPEAFENDEEARRMFPTQQVENDAVDRVIADIHRRNAERNPAMDVADRPASGMKRLYRFEPKGERALPATTPDWVRESPEVKNMLAASNRWFTEDPDEARWYQREHPEGHLTHVDVPEGEAEQYRVSNMAKQPGMKSAAENPAAFSRRPEHEFFVPAHIAKERVPSMDVAGKKMPAENVALIEPGQQAVADAERGAGPAGGVEKPEPGLTPDQILARPEVQAAITRPRQIDRGYRVPYLAGSSNAGGTTFIDSSIPPKVKIGRKNVDVAKYLNIHEQVEHALMIEGKMPYEQAHRIATEHEIAAVRADGVNVDRYNDFMDGHLAHTEKEIGEATNTPPDLYLKPYPHKEAEFLAREEGGEHTFGNHPAHPVEVAARAVAASAKDAMIRSGTALDQFGHDIITKHVEPLIDQAFPKTPVATEAGPEGAQQTLAPGVAPVTDADRLKAASGKPMAGSNAPPPAGGLFDDDARAQPDMLDMIPTDRGLIERKSLLDRSTHGAVMAKLISECEY